MIYQNELWFGTHHIYKNMTGSTNDDIKELVRDNPQGGYVVRAAKQINGKGRRGRQWVSEDGGLYFSFDVSPVLMERAKKNSVNFCAGTYGDVACCYECM